jgi:LysM repeat protein
MTSEYVTQPGDSLPSIAEACGHSGEWLLIAAWNPDLADPHNIQPGMTLILPDLASWPSPGDPEATDARSSSSSSSSTSTRSSSSSSKRDD